jgi:hypothetical protein
MMTTTPIVFFAFNRPDTTQRVLNALREQTIRPPLIVAFADGARHEAEESQVAAVRQIIRAIDWTDVQLIERDRNYGGPANLIQGISQVFESYDRAVMVEDDAFPVAHFYEALNLLLDHYETSQEIFSVGGYPHLLKNALPDYPYDVILSPRFSVLGWGTWAGRWKQVQQTMHNFKNPFASPNDVPLHAGFDMPFMATEADHWEKPFFWTGSGLALLSLYHGWLHALTRNYLVNHIGVNTGQHARERAIAQKHEAFYRRHNALVDKIPLRFPVVEPRNDVFTAVQEYVKAKTELDQKRSARMFLYYRIRARVGQLLRRWGMLSRLPDSRK